MPPSHLSIPARYLILVRHGDREKPFDTHRKAHHLSNYGAIYEQRKDYKLTKREVSGGPATLSLAGWLAETLNNYNPKIIISTILCSEHQHAIETANGRASEAQSAFAERLADGAGLPRVGASDAHDSAGMGAVASEFERAVEDLPTLVEEIRAGRVRPWRASP